MCIHLDVYRRFHGVVPKCDVEVHPTVQLKGLLVVSPRHRISLHEFSLLESSHSGYFLEQAATYNGDISTTVDEAVCWDSLYLYSDTLGRTALVGDTHSFDSS